MNKLLLEVDVSKYFQRKTIFDDEWNYEDGNSTNKIQY